MASDNIPGDAGSIPGRARAIWCPYYGTQYEWDHADPAHLLAAGILLPDEIPLGGAGSHKKRRAAGGSVRVSRCADRSVNVQVCAARVIAADARFQRHMAALTADPALSLVAPESAPMGTFRRRVVLAGADVELDLQAPWVLVRLHGPLTDKAVRLAFNEARKLGGVHAKGLIVDYRQAHFVNRRDSFDAVCMPHGDPVVDLRAHLMRSVDTTGFGDLLGAHFQTPSFKMIAFQRFFVCTETAAEWLERRSKWRAT